MVEGQWQAIALNASKVYLKSDGSGESELAAMILSDVKNHAGISGMEGKLTDGQYLTDGFINAMNQPLFEEISIDIQDQFWWPLQWDPGHWLDKVFSKFYDNNKFLSRLLICTALFHTYG